MTNPQRIRQHHRASVRSSALVIVGDHPRFQALLEKYEQPQQ